MGKRHTRALAGLAGAALAVSLVPTGAMAAQAPADVTPNGVVGQDSAKSARPDNLPNPLGDAQAQLRKEAVGQLISGEATTEVRGGQRVIKLASKETKDSKSNKGVKAGKPKDRYVSYPVNREEDIFTILTEFGTQTMQPQGGTPGPLRNQIPAPDRVWDGNSTDNNSTYWVQDFNRDHYMDMMFGEGESFRDFYQKQSNGRFLAKGDVSNWVTVPFNEARYGHNPVDSNDDGVPDDGTSEAGGYWNYVKDTATAWYNDQKASGKSDAQIADYLKQFDKVDRYDYDGDGNFNEPDGYIDHFQAIHAGEGEEAGGGAEGEDAIWSHRWYAYSNNIGKTGPTINKAGGVPLGNSGIWIGDYTTEPENGGLGVFAHEFGHDLGLADYYDTNGGDNSTAFWTLMSSGSWLNWGKDSIGTTPGYMGPHEKLLLGWLDYTVATQNGDYELGPADRDSATRPQAIAVPLPDKKVDTKYNTPHSGSYEWWSGTGDNTNASISRSVDLTGKSSGSISAWTWVDSEAGYDGTYVAVSADGGATWTDVKTTAGEPVLEGRERTWKQRTWDLTPWAGKSIQVRFNYLSDGGLNYSGIFLDDFTVTAGGATVLTDNVETGDNGWTAKGGFTRMGGSTSVNVQHYYLAENRVYSGYDATLKVGPYNFGWADTKPDWVERFPYQNGMLVWYVDGAYADNNTSAHPGGGMALPVDARPAPLVFSNGAKLANRRGAFDATFTKEGTDEVTFHNKGVPLTVPSRPGISVFNDSDPNRYYDAANPMGSVKVAGSGTSIEVRRATQAGQNMTLRINVPQ